VLLWQGECNVGIDDSGEYQQGVNWEQKSLIPGSTIHLSFLFEIDTLTARVTYRAVFDDATSHHS